jgi:hypothetical protein
MGYGRHTILWGQTGVFVAYLYPTSTEAMANASFHGATVCHSAGIPYFEPDLHLCLCLIKQSVYLPSGIVYGALRVEEDDRRETRSRQHRLDLQIFSQ